MITLVPISNPEFDSYWTANVDRYAQENIRAGYWNATEAQEKSRATHARLLPKGLETPNHHLFSIQESQYGKSVGILWLFIDRESATPSGFIYDLFIHAQFRHKGFGAGAMHALEVKARELGLERLYLHVFAHNEVAKSLYDKLGYETTSVNMMKKLSTGN